MTLATTFPRQLQVLGLESEFPQAAALHKQATTQARLVITQQTQQVENTH